MKHRKILITGGSGFLGSNLAKELAESGNQVTLFDNEFRGKIERIKGLKVKYVKGDIRNYKDLKKLGNKYDAIYHLAFINGTDFFYNEPQLVLDVGINGILNIIKFTSKIKKTKFYLASSSEVYNLPKKIPTNEKAEILIPDILNPRFSYSGGKIISELVTINYLQKFKIPFQIFRPHNIFGPNMGMGHVIPQIIKKIYIASNKFKKKKCKVLIQGKGNETRSFCYVDDAVKQLNFLLNKSKNNQIYNIGQSKEISISKLVKEISKILEIKVEIKYSNLLPGSVKRRCPSLNKLRKLDFRIINTFTEGLKTTVLWYKHNFLNEK